MLDKAQSGNISGGVAANSVNRTRRLPQQAAALVVANRFDVNPRCFREAPDSE